jgi:signal transduction histidine kinase
VRQPGQGELVHERALAERTALIRLLLTLANFAIIWLDHTIPQAATPGAYAEALGAATAFSVYAAAAWLILKRQRISLARYFTLSPILDVGFAALLILTTDGYLSPFHLWFVLAVVSSGFSRAPRLPLITAVLALAAHCLIALVPQAQPLDVTVFAVRSGYLFGVAAVLSSINQHLAKESRALAAIAETGRMLSEALTPEAAARILLIRVVEMLRTRGARFRFADGSCLDEGVPEDGRSASANWSLQIAGQSLGWLTVYRKTPLTRHEEAVARVLCDRAASALLRIRLGEQLVSAARAEERVRLADQLHDTYLQTLAALDLRAEAAYRLVNGPSTEVASELQAIKQISQQAGAQIRQALAIQPAAAGGQGPAALRKLLAERWAGQAEVDIAPDMALSDGQWRAVEALVKEGLNNARKHAGAERISLRLQRDDGQKIVCSLENDGTALPAQPEPGYGLARLRAVIEEQGGELSLAPRESGGALLLAKFGGPP